MRGSCKCSCRHTTPLQVCGSSGSTVITPAFITPPNTPCGCSDALSHPQTHLVGVRTTYHTRWFITPPLGPLRAALHHPGYTRYHPPHRILHPVIVFLNPKISCYHRCVLSCVSYGTRNFWESCNTFIPVPQNSGSSVRLPYPYPESTNPTEHNLGTLYIRIIQTV